MSFVDDDDILQDFLVEAGEILEGLSEQLVELEQRPDDKDLLNAIFRGFHTVKGGAGFLQLEPMVDLCHATENLFDALRSGQREVTTDLMDVVLQALDSINTMYALIQNREEPPAADPALLETLHQLMEGDPVAPEPPAEETAAPVADEGGGSNVELFDDEPTVEPAQDQAPQAKAPAPGDDITDSEFEQLLDALDDDAQPRVATGKATKASADSSSGSDDISEDEFEALLDQLHGQGKGPGGKGEALAAQSKASVAPSTTPAAESAEPAEKADAAAGKTANGDEITEDEFEALLDQLHGSGKAPVGGAPATEKPAEPPAAKAETPAKAEPAAAKSGDELITEDEFEALLDQLHGKGKAPSTAGQPAEPAQPAKPAAKQPTPPKADSGAKTPAAGGGGSGQKPPAAPKPASAPKEPAANMAAAETTVRVDTQRLDDIMNMVGELVLVRNRLVRLGLNSGDEEMGKAVANLDVVTADLQASVMKTRMQPIKKVFGRFPRVVRDLARNMKKEINLELVGEETDLDKNLVEALADPLVHLVRNAVDHGIEAPSVREETGKPRVGKVILAAEQEGDHILLSITDDGGGMDPEKLRVKAVEKGMMDSDAAARLSDSECFDLIFHPGFSTKAQISDVSGRGVGMDVVKTKITQLNGSIEISSKIGEGTRIAIKVPLTLAIMPTLMVMLGDQTFALPLVSVNEIFHMNLTKTNVVDGQEVITVRDRALPLFHLKQWLVKGGSSEPPPEWAHVVIVSVGTQKVGFVVDQLIGQEEVVIKPLGKMLHGTPGMAGATITGDGRIALILDVPSMLKRYAH